jgi:hypothetical protein
MVIRLCPLRSSDDQHEEDVMATTWPPSRETELIAFSLNFKTKITASPTTYSLTALQATEYGALHDAFVAAHAVANDPLTRSPRNISLKDEQKWALVDNLRLLGGIVQRAPGTTNPLRIDLGLPPRGGEPTPWPAPDRAPLLTVVSVNGRLVRLRIRDPENPDRRGKADGIDGIAIFSYVGATAPEDLAEFKFEGNTKRMLADVEFPLSVPHGAKVHFCAFFFNPRAESGPACAPVSTYIQYGDTAQAA